MVCLRRPARPTPGRSNCRVGLGRRAGPSERRTSRVAVAEPLRGGVRGNGARAGEARRAMALGSVRLNCRQWAGDSPSQDGVRISEGVCPIQPDPRYVWGPAFSVGAGPAFGAGPVVLVWWRVLVGECHSPLRVGVGREARPDGRARLPRVPGRSRAAPPHAPVGQRAKRPPASGRPAS